MILAQTLAIGGLIHLLLVLIVVGLIFYVIWWALGQIHMPDPISTVVRVILILIIVLVLLGLLLPLLGIAL